MTAEHFSFKSLFTFVFLVKTKLEEIQRYQIRSQKDMFCFVEERFTMFSLKFLLKPQRSARFFYPCSDIINVFTIHLSTECTSDTVSRNITDGHLCFLLSVRGIYKSFKCCTSLSMKQSLLKVLKKPI